MSGVQHVDWALVAPVLCPAVGAVVVLVVDAVLPRPLLARRGVLVADVVAFAALLGGVIALLPLAGDDRGTFCVAGSSGGCSYAVEPVTTGLQLVTLLAAIVCLLLAIGSPRRPPRAEHHLLLLTATAGAVAVAGARDLGTLVVALELASLPAIGLVALRRNASGAEAALKLLLTSVVSVAVLVLGVALLYAACGTIYLGSLSGPGSLLPTTPDARALAGLGIVVALAGLAFKVSIVPFQLWTPDTYAGAPLPIAAFLSAVSKAAGLGAIVVLLVAGGLDLSRTWVPAIGALAAVTMTVGNLVALRQDNAIRLLAWSTVAQAGWVILPLAGASATAQSGVEAAGAAVAYLAAYIVASLLAFSVVAVLAREVAAGEQHSLSAYTGLVRRRPVLAGCLLLALASLAGLPPGVVGLVAKIVALRPVVQDQFWLVAAIAVANVALGVGVYLRWAIAVVRRTPEGEAAGLGAAASRPEVAALVLSAVATVVVSIAPQLVAGLTNGL